MDIKYVKIYSSSINIQNLEYEVSFNSWMTTLVTHSRDGHELYMDCRLWVQKGTGGTTRWKYKEESQDGGAVHGSYTNLLPEPFWNYN